MLLTRIIMGIFIIVRVASKIGRLAGQLQVTGERQYLKTSN
jgi:hypothetical protein